MRAIQTDRNPSRWRHTLSAIGDSITFNGTLGVPPQDFWPELLAVRLRALGCACVARNFGISGNTSTQALVRKAALTHYETPDIALIDVGRNDPGNSIVGATTQANIEAMIQHVIDAGCDKVIVLTTQYRNYSSGGDTTSVPEATYATLRTFQAAAVTAKAAANPSADVVLCDVYAHMRGLIVAGTYTQGDHLWHVADQDQHLNAIGEGIVADAVAATIQAQSGWVAALET